ncbi:MAG: DEAD/DEAH box helicase family protein [Lachnospiraceae bacterium]|nr:DEAD/DEAH box helicase family protein [Lachnospiraceae bacterium]
MNLQGDCRIHISVRNLVEFIFRSGDLDSRRRTAADQEAMLEGSRIHRKIQKSMGGTYQAEVPLKLNLSLNCGGIPCELLIDGRADGVMESEDGEGVLIDEIKGMYRDVMKMEKPIYVHEAQAMCYAYMYLAREGELEEELADELTSWLENNEGEKFDNQGGVSEKSEENSEKSGDFSLRPNKIFEKPEGNPERHDGISERSEVNPERSEEETSETNKDSEEPDGIPGDLNETVEKKNGTSGKSGESDEISEDYGKKIVVQMTYVSLDRGDVKRFRHGYTSREISDWFCGMLLSFKKWVDFVVIHRNERNESLRPLQFPYPYREGQRDMVVSVYRAISRNKNLYVQAPTGIGKTMSAVFPAAKAMGEGRAEKIFYLTAKTITRTVAEEAFSILSEQGAKLKTVSVTAKEKLCVCDSPSCNPVDCPRAKGHFDRVNYAVYDIIRAKNIIRREDILAYSEKYQVCPFEFCLDITDWMDGILCDYNYVFDPDVKLKRYFSGGNNGGYIFLVDEAHNLIDRGREMYSAKLRKEDFLAVKKIERDMTPDLKKKLEKCNKVMLSFRKELEAGVNGETSADECENAIGSFFVKETETKAGFPTERKRTTENVAKEESGVGTGNASATRIGTRAGKADGTGAGTVTGTRNGWEAPKKNWMLRTEISELTSSLNSVQETMNRQLEDRLTHTFDDAWMDLYFAIREFLMVAALLDDHYRIYVEKCSDGFYVNLFCVNPSKNLKECMDAGIATVLYSATFLPITYYKELLSGQKDDYAIYLPSPFPQENRALLAVNDVSTKYTARSEAQYRKMAQTIAEVVAKHTGNYMVFLPSYKMLAAVAEEFEKITDVCGVEINQEEKETGQTKSRDGESELTLENWQKMLSKAEEDSSEELQTAEKLTEEKSAAEKPAEESCAMKKRTTDETSEYAAEKKMRCRILLQKNRMTEQEREAFLRCFTDEQTITKEKTSLVAFCVLGGIFSEGIDLKHESLIGVFVVGTGIPQICTEREILRQYFEENDKNGFDYAYRFPGMNKVMQAAGRVIRTHEDTGIICLMDGRFREPANSSLFPAEWEDVRYLRSGQAGEAAEMFWRRIEI